MSEMNTAHGDPSDSGPEPHPFDGQFEPAVEAIAKGNPYIPLPEIAQASIAISLKRIADVLEPLSVLARGEGNAGLENLLWSLGHSFGHGVEQGRRR